MHDALIPLDPPYVYHVVSHSSTWRIVILSAGATRRGRFRSSDDTGRVDTDRPLYTFVISLAHEYIVPNISPLDDPRLR